ncbi:sporulation integral membrane protein YtvI [Pseudalkalibacillus hwajinpoensis]|uniref:Sporulation integral membrane protein YtvI n=1 Tax=Guptibacillus hwajinpoensis TaxID=208199 RepID=A0A4U1MLF2_9BACL|nr:sporulation integral membrane protein YtvI [Pseudalkalibacillus hwajinpoensis]TKD71531.1 sporulation integral membrane protein YtvI [Pseudalkalibacillus hwajinpoensis]
MLTFYRRYARTAFDIGLIVLTVFLIMLVSSFLFDIAAPILVGYVIFLIIEPFARFLNRRGLGKTAATTISTLLFVLVVVSVVFLAGAIFVLQLQNLIALIPGYVATFQEQVMSYVQWGQLQLNALPPDVLQKAQDFSLTLVEKASIMLTSFLNSVFAFVTSIPTLVINFIIGIVLAYFLSIEIDMWKRIAEKRTPNTFKTAYYFLKENVLSGIASYLKAQLKLITITFVLVLCGLWILRVDNAFTLALLSAFFDVLPLLGVSAIFVPWAIYLFAVGHSSLAISLLILLAVVMLVRQIMEPKITGDSLGVSAFTILSFMIISLSLFGIAGVVLSPILLILIKALYNHGYLSKWIHLPSEEFQDRNDRS